MTLYDKNVEGNTVKRSWCEIDPETGKLVTKNIYNHDFPIERIDHFIVKVIHDHLIYPHDAYLGTSYDAYLGYPKDPSLKTQSVLIVTHSDYFKIISSMFMSTEFSRIETTDNMLNINLNHNWRLIIDNDFEHIPEYILYTELFSYIRINYMNVHYDSNDYIEPEFNIDDLKSDSIRGSERYIYGNYYRNGRKLNFWD
ncbi:hypothetical protein CONCODRAFT_83093 [Conidiobolus coronatus NRRL 28638]|uniref:Uncharacterized protein n=1 Tax=Conidiobolus coronatus (strain ATCC 28846 / CBS 209.66 / NRRL 28638) TaxID=796925 RepID=A0A137PGN5_CONC2|nr:hypothetical protein CONCODRAFT_83093 [Conidiobolus coronatus NRRL 28638]|eukprot:KXN74135.1 hypothetical protein CONCODRAFT_83093 [Conidiobolus coronatus NRRL 28638]